MLGRGPGGGRDNVVGEVVWAKGGGEELGAKQGKVVLHWEDVCFLVEVAEGGHFGGSSADAECLVLDNLEFKDVGFGEVREPDRGGIG